MRNLTISRRKSFVGSIMKDLVYVSDPLAQEITIDGVPCRKIGDIKNGETKTFSISEGQQQIFLIADKASKDYCNASLTIPEGQEDLTFSGVHKFYLGSNPFRFDGVELSQEQLTKQKKNNNKGLVIVIAASIFGVLVGSFLPKLFSGKDSAAPKVFTKEDFQITLTDAFKSEAEPGLYASYGSKTAMVFVVREEKERFGDITLEEYGDLVLQANNKAGSTMNRETGFLWFEYTDTPNDQEIYYLAACYKSADAYWVITYATPVSNRDKFQPMILEWASSVKFQ